MVLPSFAGFVSKPQPAGVAEYYKVVTVDAADIPSDQSNIPVVINLASDSDLVAHAAGDGDDLYVTSSDGLTELKHELVYFDASTGQLELWFKAPSLSSSVSSTFRFYYGDDTRANSEDPDSVWSNSFEAIYHMEDVDSTDYNSLAIAQDGAELSLGTVAISPAAYYYNGVTYIVYQAGGTSSDPYILAYTHSGGTWSGPVKVGTNPLTDDWHGVPAVIVDNSGYIHVFYGNHTGAFEYAKSDNPEDISAFTAQTDVGSNETYANLLKADDGTIYLISRSADTGGDYTFRTSADAFVTETTFLDMDSGFDFYASQVVLDSTNDRIHIAGYISNGTDRLNIYHVYLDLGDLHVYAMDGTDLGTSATRAELNANGCNIVSGSTASTETQIPAIALDSNEYPHIIYSQEDGSGGVDWKHIYWSGAAWETPVVITTTDDDYRVFGDLYFSDTAQIEAYLSVAYGKTTRIEHWRWASSTWSKVGEVLPPYYPTQAGGINHPHTVVNGVDGLRWVFCERGLELDYTIGKYEVFATDSSDNFITRSLSGVDKDVLIDSLRQYHVKKAAGTAAPTEATGQIWKAQTFDGGDYANYPGGTGADIAPSPTDQVTVEAWIKHPSTAASREIFNRGGSGEGYYIRLNNTGKVQMLLNGGFASAVGSTDLDDDTWRKVAGTYDKDAGGTDELKVYQNGVQDGTGNYSTAIGYNSSTRAYVGALNGTPTNPFNGEVDELRISNVARSADWLLATHNIESGSTVSLGAEQSA